jgi:hypothetical protein
MPALKDWTENFGGISGEPDFGEIICEGLLYFLILDMLDIVAVEKFNNKIGFGA